MDSDTVISGSCPADPEGAAAAALFPFRCGAVICMPLPSSPPEGGGESRPQPFGRQWLHDAAGEMLVRAEGVGGRESISFGGRFCGGRSREMPICSRVRRIPPAQFSPCPPGPLYYRPVQGLPVGCVSSRLRRLNPSPWKARPTPGGHARRDCGEGGVASKGVRRADDIAEHMARRVGRGQPFCVRRWALHGRAPSMSKRCWEEASYATRGSKAGGVRRPCRPGCGFSSSRRPPAENFTSST